MVVLDVVALVGVGGARPSQHGGQRRQGRYGDDRQRQPLQGLVGPYCPGPGWLGLSIVAFSMFRRGQMSLLGMVRSGGVCRLVRPSTAAVGGVECVAEMTRRLFQRVGGAGDIQTLPVSALSLSADHGLGSVASAPWPRPRSDLFMTCEAAAARRVD